MSKLTTLGLKKKGGTIGVLNRAGRPVTQLALEEDFENVSSISSCGKLCRNCSTILSNNSIFGRMTFWLFQIIENRSHLDVVGSNSTGVVSYQSELHPVVSDVDIRVMSCFFSFLRDLVDESYGRYKVSEDPRADDLSVYQLPFGQVCQGLVQLVFLKLLHFVSS